MAKRRRVANLMALAVLAAVIERPMHPYEMATVLRERGKDRDMKIKWGSLYTVVANMEKHGFLEAVESSRDGGRPERTVYRITEAGHAELVDWARELVADPEREPLRFTAALSVLPVLHPDEAIALLGQRLALLETRTDELRTLLAETLETVPRLFLIEDQFELSMTEAETAWVRGFLEDIAAGALPGIAGWRKYHESGSFE